MSKKRPSAAEAKRRRAELLAERAEPKALPPSVQAYISQYRAADASDTEWDVVGPVVKMFVIAAAFSGDEAVKKHCAATSAYVLWRHRQHLSLATETAMTHEAIDQFFLHGMNGSPRSKNDYRSRLHNLASRVNPGLDALSITVLGYTSVRPGYTAVEEATIRRIALRQRRPSARRKLCAVVGFAAGGGLDSQELSLLWDTAVDDRGDASGIVVDVPGARARQVVIRRDYEELVRVGLVGLKSKSLVLGRVEGRSGAASAAIEDAELFDDCPRIDARLLRTTWITWLLTQPIPLNVILQASGLKSARTLTDLLAMMPTVDPSTLLRDGRAS